MLTIKNSFILFIVESFLLLLLLAYFSFLSVSFSSPIFFLVSYLNTSYSTFKPLMLFNSVHISNASVLLSSYWNILDTTSECTSSSSRSFRFFFIDGVLDLCFNLYLISFLFSLYGLIMLFVLFLVCVEDVVGTSSLLQRLNTLGVTECVSLATFIPIGVCCRVLQSNSLLTPIGYFCGVSMLFSLFILLSPSFCISLILTSSFLFNPSSFNSPIFLFARVFCFDTFAGV